jgi:hypothetical protein
MAKNGKHHPLRDAFIRRRVMLELVKTHGYSRDEAREMTAELDDGLIQTALNQTEGAMQAIGDGTLLQKLIDFIQSPQGQALIALLIKLLTGGM